MPRQPRLIQLPLIGKIFLCTLACVYAVYMVVLGRAFYSSVTALSPAIVEHMMNTSSTAELNYWTTSNMQNALDVDEQVDATFTTPTSQATIDTTKQAAKQEGQPPASSKVDYPHSTIGKIFFSNDAGQNMVCSGTAITSANHNTVDTAGHCLYWSGAWVKNLIFCPLYDQGHTPFGCWAARALEVPSDWMKPTPNDFHHDFGMAIVAPNDAGSLTDMVGGAGWAYNQAIEQPFYAYGYPAAPPFDGQTRKACEDGSKGTSWKHGAGTVVSIPCNMTGGSSGGPWFMKVNGNWYINGHNDFISSMQPGHMFSPYYDDTWYALYSKAQES